MKAVGQPPRQHSTRLSRVAFKRFALPYPVVVILLGALVAAEQVIELNLDTGLGRLTATRQSITFVVMLVYMLVSLRFLRQRASSTLLDLRPAVLIDDEAYDRHTHEMIDAKLVVALGLVVVSVALGAALTIGDVELVNALTGRPGGWALLALIALTWSFMVWLVLLLLYASIRQARTLGQLARCPLTVNVYDPSGLLPFGRLSLWHGLVIAGLALIPLILLGMPTHAGYLVVGFSLLGLLAVFIPLWGVHQQMSKARAETLTVMSRQLLDAQTQWLNSASGSADDAARLSGRINTLLALRKVTTEAPSWPFRSEAALIRAAIAAASPLIYFILNQLILKFWLSGILRP